MTMKVLRDRILADGICLEGGILKVDRFLNHQLDIHLMKQIAVEFLRRFSDLQVNKIVTIESSGIAPSVMLGYLMELPVVFAKKQLPSTLHDAFFTTVHSFTKQCDTHLLVSREFLSPGDHVLFIDDFLAYGNAAKAINDLCCQAGATVEGMGFVIEKEMLHARQLLRSEGINRIESLVIVDSLENGIIHFKEDK